jgi:hypothetical protein
LLTEANAGVEPAFDDVDDRCIADDLDLHVRVGSHEVKSQRA